MLKAYELELERDKKISKALEEEYSDDEKMQKSIKLDITVNYWLKQLECAKKWVMIKKCILINGILYKQEKEIVKYDIQQIKKCNNYLRLNG